MASHYGSFMDALAARYERNQARRSRQVAEIAKRATVVPRIAGLGRVGDDVLARMGLRSMRKNGYSAPAATGIPMEL